MATELPEPDDMERGANTGELYRLAREYGLDPDQPAPVGVAKLLPAFGRATTLRARQHLDDPDALRWLAVAYAYWAGKLAEFANAAEAANHDAMTSAAEEILRGADETGSASPPGQ